MRPRFLRAGRAAGLDWGQIALFVWAVVLLVVCVRTAIQPRTRSLFYTYASAGFGTTLHLSGEMMNSMAGVEVMHVPYKGAGPAMNDLLGGRVDMLFDNLPGSLPSVQAGLIRPIAVTAAKRIPQLPDVPAMAEILPGFEMTSWTIMIGPAGIRGDVIERANALTVTALASDFVKKRYADLGATVWPTSPDEAMAYRDKEEKRLLPIMKAAGIKPE